jgi:hypothetical protein
MFKFSNRARGLSLVHRAADGRAGCRGSLVRRAAAGHRVRVRRDFRGSAREPGAAAARHESLARRLHLPPRHHAAPAGTNDHADAARPQSLHAGSRRAHGRLTRITHLTEGEVFDPEPSYDGRTILFSMRRDGEDWFHLYEIGADGTGLVQLTDGPFNDVSGVYLPDGRIVFVSDRAGYLEEYHEERTETLWIMQADGTGIEQLTFNPGTVFDPDGAADGRILFSLWDTFMLNIPPADKHETYLMTVRPDGTEEAHFFGAANTLLRPRAPFGRGADASRPDARRHPAGADRIGACDLRSVPRPPGATRSRRSFPRRPRCSWAARRTASICRRSAAAALRIRCPTADSCSPAPCPANAILGIYLGDPRPGQAQLVFNDPERAEFDPRPILLERPRPQVLPPKAPSMRVLQRRASAACR